jgi:TPR repeat protein
MLHRCIALAVLLWFFAALSPAAESAGKKYAVVVGVNVYERELSDLTCAENDAEEMGKVLTKAGFTVTLLTTRLGKTNAAKMPTAANIRKAVAGLVKGRSAGDTVMVCLSGHGVELEVEDPEGKDRSKTYPYFCPHDFSKSGIRFETGNGPKLININWLFREFESCDAGRKIVLVDACRNVGKAVAVRRNINAKSVTVPDGVCAMFSCSSGQVAYEIEDLGGKGHGAFFYYVLEGLKGKAAKADGRVTWAGLTEYVAESVEKKVREVVKKKQTPHQVTNVVGTSPVLLEGTPERPAAVDRIRPATGDGVEEANRGDAYYYGRGVAKDYKEAFEWYAKSAGRGYAYGLYSLGYMHRYGQGTARDDRKAAEWLRKAVAKDQADAMYELGMMYAAGLPERDDAEAVRLYGRAAAKGHPGAMVSYGYMHEVGRGTKADLVAAVKWYRQAAENGNLYGMTNLAYLYETGRGVPKEEREAVRLYQQAAEKGHPRAMCNLGLCYANGRGVLKSDEEAVKWYKKAAEKDYADAVFYLGVMYEFGRGVPADLVEAVRWYRKAADMGDPYGMTNLGWMYYSGRGTTKDYGAALRWFRKAADLEHPRGMYLLGHCLGNGHGVPKDDATALAWYRKSADKDHLDAINQLGVVYEFARGVAKDLPEAVKWYRKAADRGHVQAQYNLADMYEHGKGVPTDREAALVLYRRAARQGHAAAKAAIDRLEGPPPPPAKPSR